MFDTALTSHTDFTKISSPKDIQTAYFETLKKRNPAKYASYVWAMKWIIPLVMRYPRMMNGSYEILPTMYAACRMIDDVIDGDLKYTGNTVDYARARLDFLENPDRVNVQKSPEDKMIARVLEIAQESGNVGSIQESIKMIVKSMLFDAERVQAYQHSGVLEFPKGKDLEEHFEMQDILWTGLGMGELLQLGRVENFLEKVVYIGRACRIEYNLTDFVEDLEKGIVNISSDDAEKYHITIEDLLAVRSLPCIIPLDPKNPSKILHQALWRYPESIQDWR